MKKIISKLNKLVISIIATVISFQNKVLALVPIETPIDTLYGPPRPEIEISTVIWRFAKTIIVPLAVLIGIMVYLKKSTSSKKKKILIAIGIVVLAILACFIIDKIIV